MRPLGLGREVVPGVRVLAHLTRSRVYDVYDAWSDVRASRVIVKTLRPDRRGHARSRTSLLREGRLLRRFTHPHLVRAYEVHDGDRPAVVLETLSGETLGHMIDTRGRIGPPELRHLGAQLASAVGYLHGEGLLHLDVKPGNVVAEAGRAKLLDLSVARAPGRMRAGRGTWCSMAPEQARGGEVTAAADVWGVALVLYEAASGINPFHEAGDDHDYPQLHLSASPLRSARPRLPRDLAALIDAGLAQRPDDRPAVTDFLALAPPAP
jgi:serine/threonine protein kinase